MVHTWTRHRHQTDLALMTCGNLIKPKLHCCMFVVCMFVCMAEHMSIGIAVVMMMCVTLPSQTTAGSRPNDEQANVCYAVQVHDL